MEVEVHLPALWVRDEQGRRRPGRIADISWPGTSSVNWFGAGQELANNAFVRIPDSGLITVRCGGQGPTQFVIDIIGASGLVDASALAAVQEARATANFDTWSEQ